MLAGQGAAPAAQDHVPWSVCPTQPASTAPWLNTCWRATTRRGGLTAPFTELGQTTLTQGLGIFGQRGWEPRTGVAEPEDAVSCPSEPSSLSEDGTSIIYILKS